MKTYKYLLIILLGIFLLIGCSNNSSLTQVEETSTVEIHLGMTNADPALAKSTDFINSVIVKISSSDFDTQTKQLTIQTQNGQRVATGTFDVKKGSSRTFEVEGRDANQNRLFHGTKTVDLNESEVSLTIPIQWDPFQVVYDDGNFEEYRVAMESGVIFFTQFISPVTPVNILGVRVHARDPLNYGFDYDIDFYDTDLNYLDTYPASLTNNGDWNDYDVTSMGLSFNTDFYVSVYAYDGPDGNGAYGPYVDLDTNSQGNSFYYVPSTGVTSSIAGHWGIRIIVEVGGTAKELAPVNTEIHLGNRKNLPPIYGSQDNTPQIGLLEGFNLLNLK